MATCNYCNATIPQGVDTCPHCGADLSNETQHEIKIETRTPFVIKATFKRAYAMRRFAKALIVFPFIVVPGTITIEVMFMTHTKNWSFFSTNEKAVLISLILLSSVICFFALLNVFASRSRKTKCTISENELECVIKGTNRVFMLDQVLSVDCMQTDLQQKYETGDIRVVLNKIGYIVFRDIDDYEECGKRLKEYVDAAKRTNR